MITPHFVSVRLFSALLFLCFLSAAAQETAPWPPSAPILRIETGSHTAVINRVSTDRLGRYVVTASDDKTARVWDSKSGALVRILRPPVGEGNSGTLYAAALSPDGRTVACGGYTNPQGQSQSLYLFDRATGQMTQRIGDLPNLILDLVYSPDGKFLAVTFSGRTGVRVYQTSSYAVVGQDKEYGDDSYGAAFASVNGALRLATSSLDGALRLYDVSGTALKLRVKRAVPGGRQPRGIAFSPDGSKVAVGYGDSAQVDVLSGSSLESLFQPDTSGVGDADLANVAWSADGRFLYGGGRYAQADRKVIRRWAAAGKSAATDVAVADSTLFDLVTRPPGGVFFGSGSPAWGALDAAGHEPIFVGASIADYRYQTNGLHVSADGGTVQFPYQMAGKSPAVFSLSSRSLTPGAGGTDLHAPITSADGLDVQDWDGTYEPSLGGKTLPLVPGESSRSLAIAPDRQHFVLGTSFAVRLYDPNGTPVWAVPAPGVAWDVNISGDGKLAIAAFADGTIRWYRMADGHETLALFPHADRKRWVLWTPGGYYDCSPGGESLIGWHVNHGPDQSADFFPVGRFRDTYYRPDVVAAALAAPDEQNALRQANDASGRRPAPKPLPASLPPVVEILSPDGGAAVSAKTVTLKYSVRTPSGEPVTGVKVLVDGRPIQTTRDLTLVPAQTNSAAGATQQISVPIPARDCTVSVIAENRYAVSEAATVALTWHDAAKPQTPPVSFAIKPTLYVLAIGISQYKDPDLTLTYPSVDARSFADTMRAQKGRLYADVQERVLLDGDANRDAIADGLDWIQKQTTQHDIAMVFLAGHGANDTNGDYFFVPANFDRDHIKSTSLPFSDIKTTVESLAGKTLFFVDSCHSGNVLGKGTSRGVDIVGAVNELSSAENGAVVFAASTGRQVALEDPAWGHGAFTKALIEGLGGKANYNHDGTITVNMLDLYISQRVKQLTDGAQTPTTAKPQTVPDFPVAVFH